MQERAQRRFFVSLTAITILGLAIRVVYVLVWRRSPTNSIVTRPNDAAFYHQAAQLLADGKGFLNPFFSAPGHPYQSADHPPVYQLFLAFFDRLGLSTPTEQMLLTSALLGTPAVWFGGLAGREVFSPRTGLIAAFFVAVYPNVWSWDGMLLSESAAIVFVTLTIWSAYRYWHRPTTANALLLGAMASLAGMSRAELILLLPLVALPLVWRHGIRGARPVAQRIGALALAALVIVGPWVGYNMTRFAHPVYLSVGFEITVASASCDPAWFGPTTGYWSPQCVKPVRDEISARYPPGHAVVDGQVRELPVLDQSQETKYFRQAAVTYIEDHKRRVPAVLLARWGRITGLFRPVQQAQFDWFPEGRDRWVTRLALWCWYPLATFALAGVFVLRKRRTPLYPLLVPLFTVLFAVTAAFASTRYRASAEPAICILAAVAVDAVIERLRAPARDAPVTAGASGPRA